ncbi:MULTISPECIES: MIP/aquaporin family protein [Sporomusa]|jgi:glycerol uptake facilitator protein|uniref:MIP/aquaporin family protein n=1 Tax=Sporomusa TaxID=2375 RepID=UPI001666BD09|nr:MULTISPECIES: MIP/aquaporin family protein [Sporomusa]MCM0757867.1 aquaporin family protein [Sporomusa sphaeroides DSM 2875]
MSTPYFGEFMGVAVLCFLGNGVVASSLLKLSKAEGSGWFNIITGWMVAVGMGVYVAIACGAPQADINPAVTFAKLLNGVYNTPEALVIMVAQVAGGILGGCLTYLFFRGHWELTEDPGIKLAVFSTGPAIRNYGQNLLCEIMATFMLVFVIFAMFSKPVGGMAPGFGPFMVAVLVWGLGSSLGGTTGYAMNPARDLGPRIAHALCPIPGKGASDWAYSWVPVVGPFIGGGIAFAVAKSAGIL